MTLFVEIDVSKYKHDLAIFNGYGEIISKHFQFSNTYQGFQQFKENLETLEIPTSELHIAREDIGHYADNFVAFLQKIGYRTFTFTFPLYLSKNLLGL